MSVTTATHLIEPHGGKLVDRTGSRPDGIERLEQLQLTPRELSGFHVLLRRIRERQAQPA